MGKIAWGSKVSGEFLDRVYWIANALGVGDGPEDGVNILMACMAWESGRSFSASKANMAGSGAVGLIQFMPTTAIALGTTSAKLAAMSPEDQLNYVYKYFKPFKGRLETLADVYMAILWPAAVGKRDSYVLFDRKKTPTTFRQNAGLDKNKDGKVTKAECSTKLYEILAEGFRSPNARNYDPIPPQLAPMPFGGFAKRAVKSVGKAVGNVAEDVGEAIVDEVADEIVDRVVREPRRAAPAVPPHTTTAVVEQEQRNVIVTTAVEPNDKVTAVKKAISGWQGNLAGGAAILGSLLLNPDFTAALGGFLTRLASGDGSWGGLLAALGAALIVYKHRPA